MPKSTPTPKTHANPPGRPHLPQAKTSDRAKRRSPSPAKAKAPRLSKKEIIAAHRKTARKLGRIPGLMEFCHLSGVGVCNLRREFGGYTQLLEEAGLEARGAGYRAPMEELFAGWAALARKLGKIPTSREFGAHSRYSSRPLQARFGSWRNVPLGLLAYAEQNGLAGEWKDVCETVRAQLKERPAAARKRAKAAAAFSSAPVLRKDRPVFGPALTPLAMAHAPTNEMGVLFLFGMLAAELGFIALRIQSEFPDCKAMRRVDAKRWQEVWIEFEFESRNFLAHMHRLDGCDLIVCWEHNWPDCPLEVVELKQALSRRQGLTAFPL